MEETKEFSVYNGEPDYEYEYERMHTRKTRLLTREICFPSSKYFAYLSGLTLKELRYFARRCMIRNYSRYSKVDLVEVLDRRCVVKGGNTFYIGRLDDYVTDVTHELLQRCISERMFPDSLRAWVGLFVSDKSVSEHYARIILDVLSPMKCVKEKFILKKLKSGRNVLYREPDPIEYNSESDSDIGDW